jgi:serine/threonine protein kinase
MIMQSQQASSRPVSHPITQLPLSEISFLKCIGEGSFGEVWQGRCRGSMVAVKKLRVALADLPTDVKNELEQETAIQFMLRHPSIVTVLGLCMDGDRPLLVAEFMEGGSLAGQLYKHKVQLTPKKMRQLGLDIARGLAYLHCQQPPIMHRDLKSENILVDDECAHAKISDFGLARVKNTTRSVHTRAGTPLYMAPELLRAESYDLSADVYSFSLVLYEIYAAKRPYSLDWQMPQLFRFIAMEDQRPDTSGLPPPVVSLLEKCWHSSAKARPSMSQALADLEAIAL